jgi:hypothetical protein
MENVNTFLDSNPTEVIVFIYEVNNEVDQQVDLNAFYERMALVSGFLDKLYVHPGPNATWPTLGELTDPDVNKVGLRMTILLYIAKLLFCVPHPRFSSTLKRVIMFHYNGPNCNEFPEECPSGLNWYYNYASENDWEHGTVSSITNTDTSCVLRSNSGGNEVEWVGLNNFVSPPSQDAAQRLNSYDLAKNYVDICSATLSNDINFILADFWEQGDLPRVAQDYNRARALQQTRQRTLLRKK